MNITSKKRRLARRAALREGKPVKDNSISKLYDELTQVTNKQIKQEKKKPYLSTSEFLKKQTAAKESKKKFRQHRREHKLELQRATEKALRLKNSQLAEKRAVKRLQRKAALCPQS